MIQKPSLPKGTRDFSPLEFSKRKYIIDTLSEQFRRFGFHCIETPSFENYETLMGKYGEEGDRLIFKILNSGDFLSKVPPQVYQKQNSKQLTPYICEKALRYDLTVPFARYVVQHQNDLVFPFKRYQIQPVWRADRPQKGRYREFYQCDADIVGSDSILQEIELIQLYDNVFEALGIQGATLRINHRKILGAFTEIIGQSDKLIDFTVALDKLDKIGKEKVIQEMIDKGINSDSIQRLDPIFSLTGSFEEKYTLLADFLSSSEQGKQALEQLSQIYDALKLMPLKAINLDLNITLARGLNYYTGAIFEIEPPQNIELGSLGGGGRYDNLTEIFGLKNMSGVGISFGLDRIYLVMEELNLFPEELIQSVDIMGINFGGLEVLQTLQVVNRLRQMGYNAELYPDTTKMKKQMTYADKKQIPWVLLIGEKEFKQGTFILKNMKTGDQNEYLQSDLETILPPK